ncbi:MAG: hypothetical protein PHI68_00285 [Candidatus Cloacimonetes bacterium]|nr:hypothetical protein [Candidatus Cloacimonadota bacterium]
MKNIVVTLLVLLMVLTLASCKHKSPTKPESDEPIVELVDPWSCDYWLSFESIPGEKELYWVVWYNGTGNQITYSLTLNGEIVWFNENQIAVVSATQGQVCEGIFTVNGEEYPFSIKIAHDLTDLTWNGYYHTPKISWQLPASNMHLYILARYDTNEGSMDFYQELPPNRRDFTFEEGHWRSITVGTMNSFISRNYRFGVYSWSYGGFSWKEKSGKPEER